MMRTHSFRPAVLGMLALALCACASTSGPQTGASTPTSNSQAGAVQARAQTRWDLLIAGKMAEAYEFFSPGYRQIKSRDAYANDMANRPVKWTRAEVQGSECPAGAEYCDVTVNVHYEVTSTLPGVGTLASFSPVTERWINSQWSWYLVPKEVARK
jgi:hypothetical protein